MLISDPENLFCRELAMFEFSKVTIENIGYYVYCLIDSRDKTIFYIGKGYGNRDFAHEQEIAEKEKNKRIFDI